MEDIHNVCLVGPSNSSGTASGRLPVAQGDGPAVFWPPCWHCLTWTCAAGVRESRVNQLKPFGQRDVKTPDLTKEGGTQAEMLPELLLQESEGGDYVAGREEPLVPGPPGRRFCSLAGLQRQDARSLGWRPAAKGARGLQNGRLSPARHRSAENCDAPYPS